MTGCSLTTIDYPAHLRLGIVHGARGSVQDGITCSFVMNSFDVAAAEQVTQ